MKIFIDIYLRTDGDFYLQNRYCDYDCELTVDTVNETYSISKIIEHDDIMECTRQARIFLKEIRNNIYVKLILEFLANEITSLFDNAIKKASRSQNYLGEMSGRYAGTFVEVNIQQ